MSKINFLTLKRLENYSRAENDFSSCFEYIFSSFDLLLLDSEQNPESLATIIFNSGCHDLLHQFAINYMGSKSLLIDILRDFYCIYAYPNECRELFNLVKHKLPEVLNLISSNPVASSRVLAFLQKCDSHESNYYFLTCRENILACFRYELLNSRSPKFSLESWLKCGLFPWYDNNSMFLFDSLNTKYLNQVQEFPCLSSCHPDIVELCKLAYLNESREASQLFPFNASQLNPNTQRILFYLPPLLYHPFSKWNHSHHLIFSAFNYLLEALSSQFKLFPLRSSWNGVIQTEIYKEYFDASISYHTGMKQTCDRSASRSSPLSSNFKMLHYKEAYIPGTFTLDCSGYSGWHSSSIYSFNHDSSISQTNINRKLEPGTIDQLNQFFEEAISSKKTKYPQNFIPSYAKELPDKGDYILVALQVVTDTVARLARVSTYELLDALPCISRDLGVKFVIKRHPLCTSDYLASHIKALTKQNQFIFTSSANIHDLISSSRLVLTINSGVGFESLLLGKQVLTCGFSDYESLTSNIVSVQNLKSAISASLHENIQYHPKIAERAISHCMKHCFIPEITVKQNIFDYILGD